MTGGDLWLFAASAIISFMAAGSLAARLLPRTEPVPVNRRVGHLDGLRGLLAFSVLLHHAAIYVAASRTGRDWPPPEQTLINQLGAGAVALFFMVSGALFFPLILKGLVADWPGFLVKRFFRIQPMVTLSVALVLLVLVAGSGRLPRMEDLRSLLIWLSSAYEPPLLGIRGAKYLNAQVLWSLQWEWLFYLLIVPACAVIRVFLQRSALPTIMLPILLTFVALIGRVLDANAHTLTGATWWNTLPLFAAGMFARECAARPGWVAWIRQPPISAVGLAGLIVAILFSRDAYGWSFPLFALFFVTITCGNSISGLLERPATLALGELSFAIYLLHGLVLWLAAKVVMPLVGGSPQGVLFALPFVSLATVAIGFLANRSVERPAMALGESLARRLGRRLPTAMVNGLVTTGR